MAIKTNKVGIQVKTMKAKNTKVKKKIIHSAMKRSPIQKKVKS